MQERRGSTRQSIQKYITSNFDLSCSNKAGVTTYIRAAIDKGKKIGVLKQVGQKLKVDTLVELELRLAGSEKHAESDVKWINRIAKGNGV